jgi:disulfide bond formation protein DsbB
VTPLHRHNSGAQVRAWRWLAAAWVLALLSTLAALFIGEVMGMTPCVLCWYQRILMFPLALILGMAAPR